MPDTSPAAEQIADDQRGECKWMVMYEGRIALLLDGDGSIMGEVCQLPPDMKVEGTPSGYWSWFVPKDHAYGTAATAQDARRQCEEVANSGVSRAA
jgi:hypothetical protein